VELKSGNEYCDLQAGDNTTFLQSFTGITPPLLR